MRELRASAPPPRPELLSLLRGQLESLVPGVRVIAEDLLAADGRIDWVGVEADGRVVLVLAPEVGRDLEAVGSALAQRAWVASRVPDWLKLAPRLGARPEAGVRALLLCAEPAEQTRAAADALGPAVLELARYRCVRAGDAVHIILDDTPDSPASAPQEPLAAVPHLRETPVSSSSHSDAPGPPAPEPLAAVAGPFRTGLRDVDLGLEPDAERDIGA